MKPGEIKIQDSPLAEDNAKKARKGSTFTNTIILI